MLIDTSQGKAIYGPMDYPSNFVNMKHPLDYIPVPEPITPEFILHQCPPSRQRLILRTSWKTKSGMYIPMSFLVDLSVNNLKLTLEANEVLHEHGLLNPYEDVFIVTHIHYGEDCKDYFLSPREISPGWCASSNIIGCAALGKLGLRLDHDSWRLDRIGPWF
jgi:hypothetical protein